MKIYFSKMNENFKLPRNKSRGDKKYINKKFDSS